MLWRMGEDERLTTDVAHGGGTSKRMDTTLEEKINRFCMLHHPTMDKWLTTYETAKEERYDARRAFRACQRGRMVRYPPKLEVLPRFMPLLWLHQQLTKAEEEGVHVSLEEWEFSRGCSDKAIFYPKPSDERWWYVIKVAPRGARIYENYNLITVADAEPIETEVAELPDIDMTMPEDDVEPIEIELASVASKAQQSLSEQSSPTQSACSTPSALSSRRSRLSRASGPERGSERGSRGCDCCGDRDDVDHSASQRVPSERGGPSRRQTPSERDTASEGGTPSGRQTPSSSRVQETAKHTPSGTQESTPEGTPLAHRRQLPEGYSYLVDASGAIIMTSEGKEVISAMRRLCRQVFKHTVMQTFAAQRQDLKDYVIDTLYHDFPVPTPGDRFGREHMLLRMREYLKHRRDDARRATQRPDWLDREEWRQIREEHVTAPDRWEQQRRAARARIDAGSLHHLGSGGWGSFDEDFQGTTGRAASRLERSLGAQHGLAWVIELLDRRRGESPYTEPLTRAELPDPPQL
ncbi:hypothetical protein L7F22_058935 [Adiantum nelumboides]|nr:hypothetical protein [Adiantum nelumboides]